MRTTATLSFSTSVVPPRQRLRVPYGRARVVMRRQDIHPQYFEEAKVYCKGEHVLTVSGTQEEYHVEVWSGNHPFYKGATGGAVAENAQLSKFSAKYAGLDDLMTVPTLNQDEEAEGLDALKKKSKKAKK